MQWLAAPLSLWLAVCLLTLALVLPFQSEMAQRRWAWMLFTMPCVFVLAASLRWPLDNGQG